MRTSEALRALSLSLLPLTADPTGLEPAISGVTGRRVGRYTTGPGMLAPDNGAEQQELYHTALPLSIFLVVCGVHLMPQRRARPQDALVAVAQSDAALIQPLEDGEHVFA